MTKASHEGLFNQESLDSPADDSSKANQIRQHSRSLKIRVGSDASQAGKTGNEGHRQRLRERLKRDPLVLEDYELLEYLLTCVIKRKDTKPLARELLASFGNLRGVLDARASELAQVNGFGPALLLFWQALRELLARYAIGPALQREVLASPEAVARFARARLAGCDHEECWLALLDNGNHLLSWSRLHVGSVATVSLEPRDIFAAALAKKANGIILVHNHPGGSLRPSRADQEFTDTLCQLAPSLGTRFLDHLIVTDSGCFSILQKQPL